jgi:hypothetical protein
MPSVEQASVDVMETDAPVAAAPEAPAAETSSELPDEVLQIPAISALLTGSPPATFATSESQSPELAVLEKNIEGLTNSGFGLYRSQDKSKIVLFNNLVITPDEIKEADASGKLESIAVPFDELNGAMAEGFQAGAPNSSAPAPAGTPPSSSAQKKTQTARLKNVQAGSPTEGARPGQGRILNNIAKTVV